MFPGPVAADALLLNGSRLPSASFGPNGASAQIPPEENNRHAARERGSGSSHSWLQSTVRFNAELEPRRMPHHSGTEALH